jgi:transglutaminase/protease-like cytokinesis protein 3
MDSAGVETYLICDYSEPGIGHAYNMVVINNTGYIIDTTWDSGNKYQFGEIIDFKKMI